MKITKHLFVMLSVICGAQAIRNPPSGPTKESAKDAFEAGKEYAEQGVDWVVQNPLQALASVAGVGVVVTRMMVAGPILGVGLGLVGPVVELAGAQFAEVHRRANGGPENEKKNEKKNEVENGFVLL